MEKSSQSPRPAGQPAKAGTPLEKEIKSMALEAGFDVCGITDAADTTEMAEGLTAFLKAGHHGAMRWIADRSELRAAPQALWPDVRSIIMLGMNYGPDHNPIDKLDHRAIGNISVYAGNQDYHDIIKKKLKQIGRELVARYPCEIKVFVDTAPVMEKPLAAQAGLGWQGKHTNLVSRELGSWLFLGAIFTTLDLTPNTVERDHCGTCRSCLDICPTGAFPAPYKLDARRCISYLTIEHKGPIPLEFRHAIGNRIYGCDDCLAICPWNKFAQLACEPGFQRRADLAAPSLGDLLTLDDEKFRAFFKASPVKRIGRDRFIRNVLIAAGNSNDSKLRPRVKDHLKDPNPVIRETAQWALDELGGS